MREAQQLQVPVRRQPAHQGVRMCGGVWGARMELCDGAATQDALESSQTTLAIVAALWDSRHVCWCQKKSETLHHMSSPVTRYSWTLCCCSCSWLCVQSMTLLALYICQTLSSTHNVLPCTPRPRSRSSQRSATRLLQMTNSLPTLTFPTYFAPHSQAKIEIIAKECYKAAGVEYLPEAEAQIEKYTRMGFDKLPICMAKTQYSFSHDASLKGEEPGRRGVAGKAQGGREGMGRRGRRGEAGRRGAAAIVSQATLRGIWLSFLRLLLHPHLHSSSQAR